MSAPLQLLNNVIPFPFYHINTFLKTTELTLAH